MKILTMVAAISLTACAGNSGPVTNHSNPIPNEIEPVSTLFLVGDSTMSDKPDLAYPERGWGQLLPYYFENTLLIRNHAVNGRSTLSFIDEGRWDKVLQELKIGDYVLIQFGHNDQKKKDPTRYTDPQTSYQDMLRRYIQETREKGAIPLIASSICRRHFDPSGKLRRNLTQYADAAEVAAKSTGAAFFDLQNQTCGFLDTIGEVESRQYFVKVPADLYKRHPKGKEDNTHLNVVGASKVAQFFVRDLLKREHQLGQYIYRDTL